MAKNIEKMTLRRLRIIIDAYGANPQRWPLDEQGAAKVLLANNPEAQKLLNAANALDKRLDAAPKPAAADAGFLKRVSTIPHQENGGGLAAQKQTTFGQFLKGFFPARGFAPQGMALAIAGILGIWLGVSADLQSDAVAAQIDVSSYLVNNPDLQRDLKEFQ